MIRSSIPFAAAALALLAVPAAADSRLEARYAVTYTGIIIGQGSFVVEVSDDAYSAAGSASVAGVLKMVTPAKGTAAARGQFQGGKVVPASYTVNSESKERTEEVRLAGAAGVVQDLVILPAQTEREDRVPITDEHRVGVVDPMSAALMPVSGSGDLGGPEACNRTLPIYDGRQRYDLIMSYERTEAARDIKGYSGALAVCRVQYKPIAGHRANRKQVRELSENQEIFAALAPISGTRVLVPARVTIGTKIGTFVVQATHFSSEPKARTSR